MDQDKITSDGCTTWAEVELEQPISTAGDTGCRSAASSDATACSVPESQDP